MGMYTELIFGAELKEETPNEVIETLRFMVGDIEQPENLAFDAGRNPLRGGSYYFAVNNSVSEIWLDDIDKQWHISTRANIKNYDNEIGKFLEFIKPWISSGSGNRDMYAIVIYEDSIEPELHYLHDAD